MNTVALVVLARGAALENLRPLSFYAPLCDMAQRVSLLLLGILLEFVGTRGMQNEGGDHRYWEKWSDAEIAARKAEAWENSSWTTTPLMGWDGPLQQEQAQPPLVSVSAEQPGPADVSHYEEPEVTVTPLGHSPPSVWGPCYEDAAYVDYQEHLPSSSSSSSTMAATMVGEAVLPLDPSTVSGGDLPSGSVDTFDTRWDEDVSLAAQDGEILHFIDHSLVPIPEDLPLPFCYKRADGIEDVHSQPGTTEQEGDTSSAPSSSSTRVTSSSPSSSSTVDWWEEILDRRALRGRLPPSSPGRPPAALATPKVHPSPEPAKPGISQRGGKLRHGIVDRWHYPNGTVRVRQRERLAAEAASSSAAAMGSTVGPQEDQSTTSPSSPACPSTSVVDRKTLSGRRANGSALEDSSTTVGDTEPASSNSSSSSSPAVTVGFWANGVWHPRARTPAEERSHRGGSGPKRTQRRQDRVQQYLAGDWRPAWLEKIYSRQENQGRSPGDRSSSGGCAT